MSFFVLIAFGLTWIPAFALLASGTYASNPSVTTLLFSLFMLFPTIAAIATRLLTKEGFRHFGLRPHLKGHIRFYLAAWFAPALLTLIGAVVYFLLFPSHFDSSMSVISTQIEEQLKASGVSGLDTRMYLYIQLAVAVVIGPIINIVFTLGEELGWRGYLLPKLNERFSQRAAILASGVIWGLWHAPMIAMGHNYGLGYPSYPWGGILAMIAFCVFVGSFLAWLTFRTGSAFPAAIAHSGLNALASSAALFLAAGTNVNVFIGPVPIGIIGGIGFLIAGIACYLACKGKTTPVPETPPVSAPPSTETNRELN